MRGDRLTKPADRAPMKTFPSLSCKEHSMNKRITLICALAFAIVAGSAFAADQVKGPFAGTVHATGDLADKGGNAISVTWDRGAISKLSDTSITLTRRDKQQVTLTITTDTAVRNEGATYKLSD